MKRLICGLGVLCVTLAVAQPREDCSAAHVEKDGTATVRGVVTKNNHSCAFDGQCALSIRCDGADVVIQYVPDGDTPENSEAYRKAQAAGALDGPPTKLAWRVMAGEVIEAHGLARVAKGRVSWIGIYYLNSWLKVISSEGAETISVPDSPRGPTVGTVGQSYSYSVSGASSSLGHPISYSIYWGDLDSTKLRPNASSESHTWRAPGVYKLIVVAVCAQDDLPNTSSEPLMVTIKSR